MMKGGRKLTTVETMMGTWAFIMLFSVLGYTLKTPTVEKNASGIVVDHCLGTVFCRDCNSHLSVGQFSALTRVWVSLSKCPGQKVCGSGHSQFSFKSPCSVVRAGCPMISGELLFLFLDVAAAVIFVRMSTPNRCLMFQCVFPLYTGSL